MSATIKVIYRGQDLTPSDYRDMFIEVDDLVHLHYRDLKIDFSRREFEEFVQTFKQQADSLLEIIDTTDVKNGPEPGFDGEEFKIWSTNPLKFNVSSRPHEVALEEAGDGHHLKYRNYDLLLDDAGLDALKKAFSAADPPETETFGQLMELFKLNRIRYKLLESREPRGEGTEVHRILMAERHAAKARAVMAGIGMEGRLKVDSVIYTKKGLTVELLLEEDQADETKDAANEKAVS